MNLKSGLENMLYGVGPDIIQNTGLRNMIYGTSISFINYEITENPFNLPGFYGLSSIFVGFMLNRIVTPLIIYNYYSKQKVPNSSLFSE